MDKEEKDATIDTVEKKKDTSVLKYILLFLLVATVASLIIASFITYLDYITLFFTTIFQSVKDFYNWLPEFWRHFTVSFVAIIILFASFIFTTWSLENWY